MKDTKDNVTGTERGVWHNLFPHTQSIREASAQEVRRAVQKVVEKQAGVLRLLERE